MPTPQNDQTHTNNLLFKHFVGLVIKGLKLEMKFGDSPLLKYIVSFVSGLYLLFSHFKDLYPKNCVLDVCLNLSWTLAVV